LCYIFNSQETEDDIRSIAGLSLKNSLPLKWNSLDPLILAYAKQSILKGLSDPSELVKKVAGSIITTIVTKGLIDQWPEVLQKLLELIQYPETAIGAFGALEKICEDSAERLDQQSPEFVQLMIQQMLLHLQNPNADIRASVVKCINQFLLIRSDSIWKHLDGFMQMLYKLTLDPSQKVRRYVCQSFNHIVELGAEVLIPVLDAVVDFMLLNTQDEDKELALEAADFWLVFCEQETMHIHLQRFLGKILPVLLKCMIYSEDDLFILEQNADNAHVEDRQQDIAPRFHKGKTHELEGETTIPGDDESENGYEDYEDYDDEWNVRKSTAAALDTLSSVFGDDLLSDLLPTINQMLSHPDWKTKEASILAIGAVAQGIKQLTKVVRKEWNLICLV
jgi:transportin-1